MHNFKKHTGYKQYQSKSLKIKYEKVFYFKLTRENNLKLSIYIICFIIDSLMKTKKLIRTQSNIHTFIYH